MFFMNSEEKGPVACLIITKWSLAHFAELRD
jgi:hypothetical protein